MADWDYFTVWSRLEPRSRSEEGEETIRAGVRDPLWMLSRQWQVGELHLEDAGSPVAARLSVEHEELGRVRLGDDGPVTPYDPGGDGPLEAIVEREPVLRDDEPPARARAEAGLHFLRLLDGEGATDDPVGVSDFPEDLLLSAPEGPFDERGRGFAGAVEGRVLDGLEVYRRVADAVERGWDRGDPPVPDGRSALDPDYQAAATAYYEWYRDCYDEPAVEAGDAWNPERLEYEFAVATGDAERGTAFEAEEYPGGRLDWYDFSRRDDASLADDGTTAGSDGTGTPAGGDSAPGDGGEREGEGATESRVVERMPTKATFAGMPSPRWWEFENAAVNLDAVTAGPEDPVRLLALGFASLYGNDWFTMPVEVPVGSYTRVTDVTVVDTFGVRTRADPIRPPAGEGEGPGVDWNMYAFPGAEDPAGGEREAPGLLVPPVLGDHQGSDPIERVLLARDEMANLAFAVEQVIEGADGRPVDRREHAEARLAVRSIHPHGDPEEESIVLANPGSESLDLSGWTVSDGGANEYRFAEGTVLPPRGTLQLHTGGDAAGDRATDRHWESPASIWSDADAVAVYTSADEEVLREPVPGDGDSMPAYLLATSVPDHWYPFKPVQTDPLAGAYRLEFARLLDADALDATREEIPVPLGELLEPFADAPADAEPPRLFDEEVTRAGVEATRTYQRARWSDGSTHLWSGRRAGTGRGEGSSGLRFDVLDE